jgi:vacuolar-type H+-ATPase subunit C/Vma6
MGRCDYAAARAAARRARLLGERGLHELAARATTEERLAALAGGPWGAAVAAADGLARPGAPHAALGHAGRALLADPAREAREILSFLDGEPRALVAALLLLDDLPALEALLRGLVLREPADRIAESVPPAPGLDEGLVRELSALAGPEAAPAALRRRGHALAHAADEAVRAAREAPRAARLAAALRAGAVRQVARAVRGRGEDAALARRLLAAHLDHLNAVVALAADDAPEPFLAGGALDLAALGRIARLPAAARPAALAAAARAAGGPALDARALSSPARATLHLAAARARWLAREARARPLSIAVPLAYLAARAAEARRLRLALAGAERGLPADDLLDLWEA